MKLSIARPIPILRDYVRCFQQRQGRRPTDAIVPMAAHPAPLLQFNFEDPYLVCRYGSGMLENSPSAVMAGSSTYRKIGLILGEKVDVFTVHFQPSGLHRLFGIPMDGLTDQAFDAASVLGHPVTTLEQFLADDVSFDERVCTATKFLIDRLAKSDTPDVVALTANRVFLGRGKFDIPMGASNAGLSIRQFERRFDRCIGITPRLYAKIVRFYAALLMKLTAPERTWTDITYALGYYDQMHMVRDFRRLAGESPTQYVRHFATIPMPQG
ncbi:MAG: AraC family transcriptional regulator [Bradyrhizobium sp.]|nr:AraC family transcriptional regulator [Bradyrhizobium sp.]